MVMVGEVEDEALSRTNRLRHVELGTDSAEALTGDEFDAILKADGFKD